MIYIALYILLSRAGATTPPTLSCHFPNDARSLAELKVESTSAEGDAITLELKDGNVVDATFRTLTRQGAIDRQLRRGHLRIVLKEEKGRTNGSVMTSAAMLILDRGFDGRYSGRLAALTSVFEIVCD